jgi:uncharacterized protein YebE (UPF0316 family)
MEIFSQFNGTWLEYLIIPIFIFIARILDVSVGTLRIIMVSKGYRVLAPILGFIEVFVWIIAIGQIMQNLNNFYNYISYALGFAAGTYLGMYLENKISLGLVLIRIITQRDANELLEYLRTNDYVATSVDAEGNLGPVKIFFLVLKRSELNKISKVINEYNPRAFYTVEEIKYVKGGIIPNYGSSIIRKKYAKRALGKKKI